MALSQAWLLPPPFDFRRLSGSTKGSVDRAKQMQMEQHSHCRRSGAELDRGVAMSLSCFAERGAGLIGRP